MRELLPIGRFGKQAQLTPRQLRYYHALGLLVPGCLETPEGRAISDRLGLTGVS